MTDWNKLLGPTRRHLEKERKKEKEFGRNVRDFLASDTKDADWKSTYLLNNVQQISQRATSQFNKQFIYLLTIWLSSYLISHGFISEGNLFSLRAVNLSPLLFFAPPLSGFTIYRLCVCHVSCKNINKLHGEIFRDIFPNGNTIGLLNFLEPKTALDYEFSIIMQSGIRFEGESIKNVFLMRVILPLILTLLGLILLPFVAFLHICIIAGYSISWYSTVFSILIGIAFSYRGLQILAIAADLPESSPPNVRPHENGAGSTEVEEGEIHVGSNVGNDEEKKY